MWFWHLVSTFNIGNFPNVRRGYKAGLDKGKVKWSLPIGQFKTAVNVKHLSWVTINEVWITCCLFIIPCFIYYSITFFQLREYQNLLNSTINIQHARPHANILANIWENDALSRVWTFLHLPWGWKYNQFEHWYL